MESIRKVDDKEKIEALQRALVGVKSFEEEALILLNAFPENYRPKVVKYLRRLNGLDAQLSHYTQI
jgi:hypothetical protein